MTVTVRSRDSVSSKDAKMKSALWMAMMAAFVVLAVPVCAQCPGGRCRVTAGPVLASSAPVVWDAPVVRVSSVPVVAEPSHSTDMTAPPIIVPPYIPPACTGHPCGSVYHGMHHPPRRCHRYRYHQFGRRGVSIGISWGSRCRGGTCW